MHTLGYICVFLSKVGGTRPVLFCKICFELFLCTSNKGRNLNSMLGGFSILQLSFDFGLKNKLKLSWFQCHT
jgi:hypothetical protein